MAVNIKCQVPLKSTLLGRDVRDEMLHEMPAKGATYSQPMHGTTPHAAPSSGMYKVHIHGIMSGKRARSAKTDMERVHASENLCAKVIAICMSAVCSASRVG